MTDTKTEKTCLHANNESKAIKIQPGDRDGRWWLCTDCGDTRINTMTVAYDPEWCVQCDYLERETARWRGQAYIRWKCDLCGNQREYDIGCKPK